MAADTINGTGQQDRGPVGASKVSAFANQRVHIKKAPACACEVLEICITVPVQVDASGTEGLMVLSRHIEVLLCMLCMLIPPKGAGPLAIMLWHNGYDN